MRSLLKIIKRGVTNQSDQVVVIPDDSYTAEVPIQLDQESASANGQTTEHTPAEPASTAICDGILQDAKVKAERLSQKVMEMANREREQILGEAAKEAERLKAEATQEGRAEGVRQIQEEVSSQLEKLTQSVIAIKEQQERLFDEFAHDAHNFALEIAEKILHCQITLNPETMEALVHDAIGSIKDVDWLTVEVSKELSGLAETLKTAPSLSENGGAKRVDYVEGDVPVGTCLIETPTGMIDASIATQLANLKELFNN